MPGFVLTNRALPAPPGSGKAPGLISKKKSVKMQKVTLFYLEGPVLKSTLDYILAKAVS